MRRRLDLDRPVDRRLIEECVRLAQHAMDTNDVFNDPDELAVQLDRADRLSLS